MNASDRVPSISPSVASNFNEHNVNAQRQFRKGVAAALTSIARRLNGFGATDENQGTVILSHDGILRLWDKETETYRPVVLNNGVLEVNEED